MKKGLLGSTALVGAAALAGGVYAAEAPEWKLSGNMNFQFYWVDQDLTKVTWADAFVSWSDRTTSLKAVDPATSLQLAQDHGWYFGVDEAELALKVSGTADNGLNYGFKIEINVNTDDGKVADEARIQLSGGWGTLQLGDEDGAEDTMNYGGENIMGATGGFDGDQDDYLYRVVDFFTDTKGSTIIENTFVWGEAGDVTFIAAASSPGIAGDTSDHTKITYYSPRFSGFQVGASLTPTLSMDGDEFKDDDDDFENHIGLGVNYDNSFGNLRVRASAVYSAAATVSGASTKLEDISAWSVGGIVGFGPFEVGANYTDNGTKFSSGNGDISYFHWNVAAGFSTGPMSFAVGYFESVAEFGGPDWAIRFGQEWTYTHIALTADYKIAPGLASYAEINLIEDDYFRVSHEATSFVAGIKASF